MYTETKFAKRLIKFIASSNICTRCPWGNLEYKDAERDAECKICRDFVGLPDTVGRLDHKCPCNALGKKEAIRRARLALEEKGYLD